MSNDRWAAEHFVCLACDAIVLEIDWDSIDSGRIHCATSKAVTLRGEKVIVGILDDTARLEEVLRDAEDERVHESLPHDAEVWLYVPSRASIPDVRPGIVVKRVPV